MLDAAKQGLIDAFKNDPDRQARSGTPSRATPTRWPAKTRPASPPPSTHSRPTSRPPPSRPRNWSTPSTRSTSANGTGRYDPAVIAAAQNKLAQSRVNNEQTLEGLKNRNDLAQLSRDERAARRAATTDEQRAQVEIDFAQKRLAINEAYERQKLATALKANQLQMESELAATGLTEEEKAVIREKYRLQIRGPSRTLTTSWTALRPTSPISRPPPRRRWRDAAWPTRLRKRQMPSRAEQDSFVNDWSQIGGEGLHRRPERRELRRVLQQFPHQHHEDRCWKAPWPGCSRASPRTASDPSSEADRQALLTPGTADDLAAITDLRNGITQSVPRLQARLRRAPARLRRSEIRTQPPTPRRRRRTPRPVKRAGIRHHHRQLRAASSPRRA